jgi:hypothetical protein
MGRWENKIEINHKENWWERVEWFKDGISGKLF